MPLHTSPAPASALHAIRTGLASPAALRQTRVLRKAQGALTPGHPHPVHVLDTAAPDHHALSTTRFTGWRFLLHDGDNRVLGSAETAQTRDGWAPPTFSEGPFAAATHRALLQAQGLRKPYQPRLLSVPGLYMFALWLHTDTVPGGAEDVLVPLAPAPPGIPAHRPQLAATLLPALTGLLAPAPLPHSA